MLLMQLRDSLQQQAATKTELMFRLQASERAINAALAYWQQQGKVRAEACVSDCSKGCGRCSQSTSVLKYRWSC